MFRYFKASRSGECFSLHIYIDSTNFSRKYKSERANYVLFYMKYMRYIYIYTYLKQQLMCNSEHSIFLYQSLKHV